MQFFGISLAIAALTGVFCAVLSVIIAALLPPFDGYQVPVVALVSGFTGSIFAQLALAWRGRS